MPQRVGGSGLRPSAPAVPPEVAFEQWLTAALQRGASGATLNQGAQLFAAAAHDSTYAQAKNALVQALGFARTHRPELVEPLFVAVEPWLRARAAELPAGPRAAELAQLDARTLEVKVQVDLPEDLLEQVAAAQRAAVDQLYTALTVADRREEQALRSQLSQRRVGVQAQQIEGARALDKAGGPAVSEAQWGAFLGRLVSHATTPEEDKVLDLLAKKGRVDQALLTGLELSGLLEDLPSGQAWAERVTAGIHLAQRTRYGEAKDTTDKLALALLSKSNTTPSMDYVPLRSLKDGDIEALLFDWIKAAVPGLAGPLLDQHPHFPRPAQLAAVSAQLDTIAAEQGRFLADYNVLTVMHQMGRSVPWLQLLHDKLGLDKSNYLGVSVPYSGSKLAEARLNRDGFTTLTDHDPRPALLAKLQDTLGGGNPQAFDTLKEDDIHRAVAAVIAKHQANDKPILVIDDGGYVAKVIRKHFPEHEAAFKIVEWTTRGIRLFEQIPDPKLTLVSGAESRPKTEIEPAFIADSLIEHFRVALATRFPDLTGKRILVVGAGNIGRACGLAAAELGAVVSMNDLRAERLQQAVHGTPLAAEPDLRSAVKGKDAILAVTGANSLPPELFQLIDPGTVVTSASSVDIETRDDRAYANGHWGTDLSRLTVKLSSEPAASPRAPFAHPINEQGAQALEAGLTAAGGPLGLHASVERRDILAGGFVLNLGRRARVMPVQREELILLNVTEAIAQAAATSAPGKHLMEPTREARITQLFAQHHPEDYARAQQFTAPSS
jgi:hypothetical protein